MSIYKQNSPAHLETENQVITMAGTTRNKSFVPLLIKFGIGFVIAFAFLFSPYLAALSTLEKILAGHLLEIIPLALAGTITLASGYRRYKQSREGRGLLRVLTVDHRGITMGIHGKPRYNHFIPWARLRGVISKNRFDTEKKCKGGIMLGTSDCKVYQLSRDVAFEWVEEAELISKIRDFAPEARLELESSGTANSDPRYTNLWLQYFTDPNSRRRTGALVPGDLLQEGDYEVVSVIGGGGQGTAYRARRRSGPDGLPLEPDNTPVADVVLKEYVLPVHKNEAVEQGKTRLLMNEADILSKISHPQIVSMLDCFIEDHRGYIVLELIDGVSLRELIKRQGAATQAEVTDWGIQIANILGYLHNMSQPVIHRDLTPDNLILEQGGRIKLVDFTVAHQFETVRLSTVVGKQSYIAPEQVRGYPCPQSDIYSLGATIYYCLTGEDPEPITASSPGEKRPDISPELDRVIRKATALGLDERYAAASELAKDLQKTAGKIS
ncbi:MAG: serine/threonine protein kinase [Candidatus Melainabacteria bacterium]|nr:serine/threonine protein kinase [Candidatus Melainabacteria bacterium]